MLHVYAIVPVSVVGTCNSEMLVHLYFSTVSSGICILKTNKNISAGFSDGELHVCIFCMFLPKNLSTTSQCYMTKYSSEFTGYLNFNLLVLY